MAVSKIKFTWKNHYIKKPSRLPVDLCLFSSANKPPMQAIKELNEAFYHFLWDGKPDKIKRNIIINDYSDGGLKMIAFNKSLKTIWIKKYLDKTNMGKWKLFFDLELGRYGGKLCFWVA